ncbi:hypothetical protein E2C01_020026 [Portunus trituberculatus]|uniref:Uncharacterized protein n=1 Tax=Portunus trituberculatus TaxID=210409 RepID=A0A5B7E105_PORTR|nr:hypothetical protein [Portunus trituberculatus]
MVLEGLNKWRDEHTWKWSWSCTLIVFMILVED